CAVVLREEVIHREHDSVGAVLHGGFQASQTELLHAAVCQGYVTDFVVGINRPGGIVGHGECSGSQCLSRGVTGDGWLSGGGSSSNIIITEENALWVGFLRVTTDEETHAIG